MKCGLHGEIKRKEADLCYRVFLHLHSLVSVLMVAEPVLISMELNVNFATSESDRFCLKLIIYGLDGHRLDLNLADMVASTDIEFFLSNREGDGKRKGLIKGNAWSTSISRADLCAAPATSQSGLKCEDSTPVKWATNGGANSAGLISYHH